MTARNVVLVAGLFVLVALAFAVFPWLTIQSLNALGADITYTFKTWLAVVWLGVVFGGTSKAGK